MTIEAALQQATALLAEAGLDVPRLTAEVLLAHTLHRDRVWLFTHAHDELDENAWLHFGRHLHHRLQGQPTQYLTGVQEFYGRPFHVTPAVLIPRPETEHLIEHALPLLSKHSRVADIGTGSGIIGVTLALETGCPAILTDLSADALAIARGNALRLDAPVQFLQGDLSTMLATHSLDAVVSNPPYIPTTDVLQREVHHYEPHLALFAGPDGNDIYRRLIPDAARVVKPGGHLLLELGWQSAPAVRQFAAAAGWQDIQILPDLAGHPRVLIAALPAVQLR